MPGLKLEKEKSAEYYDGIYKEARQYKVSYSSSRYLNLWGEILKCLNGTENILEVGCGTGQFSKMLKAMNPDILYHGFDFSPIAISMCASRDNVIADAYNKESYDVDYDTIVCCETLEHVRDDEVMQLWKPKTKVFISLPSFDDPAHLIHFGTEQQVIERYALRFDDLEVQKIDSWWLVTGVVK